MWRLAWIAAAVFVADQASKLAVVRFLARSEPVPLLPFLDLTLVYNTGAAFGFLSRAGGWQNAFFIGVALVAIGVILFLLRRMTRAERWHAVALWLILGGAAANLVDRLLWGHVIDFVDVHYRAWHWPAFNVADSAITVGAVLIALDAVGLRPRRRAA